MNFFRKIIGGLSILCFVTNVFAADGDFSIFREGTTSALIGTGVTNIDWDTTVTAAGTIPLLGGNTDIDLADGGHYLVMYSVPTQSASGSNRSEIQSWLRINNTTNLNYGRGQGYIRRTSGADEAYNSGSAIIDVSAGDDIRVQMQRTDSNSATVQRRANKGGINILKLDDAWDYLRSRPTSNQSFDTTTWTDVTLATDDEIDATSFSRTGAEITLVKGGRYLVTYNVGTVHTSGTVRVNDEVRMTLDGEEIDGTRQVTYTRGSNSTNDGMAQFIGIIHASTTNQKLKLQIRRENSLSTTGHAIKAAETGITIAKIPDSADYIRVGETGGGQDISTTQGGLTWDETIEEDTASFDHDATNTDRINIDNADDYAFFHSVYNTRSGTANGPREGPFLEWSLTGTLYQYGSSGSYNRQSNDSAGITNSSASSSGIIAHNLLTSDYISLLQDNEATAGAATYQADRMALQGVNISTWFTDRPYTQQAHYRWRDDTTDLNTSGGFLAAQNTDMADVGANTTRRLRISVANSETATESAARTYELQFGEKVTTCDAIGTWTGVANSGSDAIGMVTTTHIDPDGEATTSGLLTNTEGWTRINGEGRESADTTGSIGAMLAGRYAELEYSIEATSNAIIGATYCFRLYDTTAGSALDEYFNYPELTVAAPDINQLHFRWRDDTTDLNTSGGFLAAEDANLSDSIDVGETHRLRLEVANTGSADDGTADTYELEYAEKVTTCDAVGSWTGVSDAADDFELAATTHIDPDGEATTSGLLANSETYSYVNGEGRESADTTGNIGGLDSGEYTELEFSLQASSGVDFGKTYCFRLYNATAGSPLDTYSVYPELTMRGGLKVQQIIGSISGATSQTETIPDALGDVERAFLLFDFSGGSSADNIPSEGTCTAHISSTTQVTVEKSAATGTCEYAIYVVEALSDEFAVRGRGSITLNGADLSATGTANNLSDIVDTAQVFVPGMSRSNGNGSDEWRETYTTLELTNSTTVTAERGNNTGTDTTAIARFEVVEWLAPGVTVQTGEYFADNLTTTAQTDTIPTAVTMNRAFVYTTDRHLQDGLAQTAVETSLTGTTQLSFRRGNTTGSLDSYIRWWVIEFPPDGVTVQRGTGSDSSGSNNDIDITIPTAVDTNKAFPVVRASNSGTGNAFPRGRFRSDIQSSTLLNINGGYSGNNAIYAWQVIDTSAWVVPRFDQITYRWYENIDAIQPSTPMVAENTQVTGVEDGDVVRLRLGVSVADENLFASSKGFKLQYGVGATCSAIGTWTDVGAIGSGEIWRGYNNATPADGANITSTLLTGSDDLQSYVEQNNSPDNPNQIDRDDSGEWDWVIEANAPSDIDYCFRLTRDDELLLDTYTQYAQLQVKPTLAEVTPVPTPTTDTTPDYTFSSTHAGTITYGGSCSSADTSAVVGNNTITFSTLSPGSYTNCTVTVTSGGVASDPLDITDFVVEGARSLDIVDSGGTPVASPQVDFGSITTDFSDSTITGTLGTNDERVRISNPTDTEAWDVTIAAASGENFWSSGGASTLEYDDDSGGVQLEVQASTGTVERVGGGSTAGISFGSDTHFSSGTSSITLISSTTGQDYSDYDVTGIILEQDIPALQPAETYTIDMTITIL